VSDESGPSLAGNYTCVTFNNVRSVLANTATTSHIGLCSSFPYFLSSDIYIRIYIMHEVSFSN